eukprot:CFRG6375T1
MKLTGNKYQTVERKVHNTPMIAPVPPQHANKWDSPRLVGSEDVGPDEIAFKKIRGILNKLTVDNKSKLIDQLLGVGLFNIEILQGLVHLIFAKACDEPHFSPLYADVCVELSKKAPNFDAPERKTGPTFKRLIVKRCEDKFSSRSTHLGEFAKKKSQGTMTPEDEERLFIIKRKMLGNIKFIGELGKLGMISEYILHQCITQLLAKMKPPNVELDDVECLCKLFETVGLVLDHEKAGEHMNTYFRIIQDLTEVKGLPARITFMLQDVTDLRANQWNPRRTTQGMKTIKEFRKAYGWDEKQANNRGRGRGNQGKPQNMGIHGNGLGRGGMYAGGMGSVYGGVPPNQQQRFNQSQHIPNQPLLGANQGMHQQMGGSVFRAKVPLLSIPSEENARSIGMNIGGFNSNNGYNGSGGYAGGVYGNGSQSAYGHSTASDDLEQMRNLKLRKDTGPKQTSFRPQNMQLPQASQRTQPLAPSTRVSGVGDNGLAQTQGPRFVAPVKIVQQKKEKTKMDLERATKRVYEEYVYNPDMVEAKQSVSDMDAPSYHTDFVTNVMTLSLEDSTANQTKAFNMIKGLYDAESVTAENVCKGYHSVLKRIEDMRLDAPKIDSLLANFAVQMVKARICSFKDMTDMLSEAGCYEVFWCMVKLFAVDTTSVNDAGESVTNTEAEAQQKLRTLLSEAEIDLSSMMDESHRKGPEFFALLKAKDLGFLAPLLLFEGKFNEVLRTHTPTELINWLLDDSHVHSDVIKTNAFIITVVCAILTHMCEKSTFIADLPKNEMQKLELQQFRTYAPVLKHILGKDEKKQMTAVYAVQVFCNANEQGGKGHMDFMQRAFMCLYRLGICNGPVFMTWKEDINDDYAGKGQSLFHVNAWLNWLEAEMEESSDEEE